ncbi:MAG: hypothetical protein ABW001_08165 [Mycobacterium sp.]
MHFKTIAAGAAIAGSLGFAALGIGTGVANAAPSPVGQFAQDRGHGGGPGWDNGPGRGGGWNGGGNWNGGGPGWGPPPPPPPPYYGYGGYNGYQGGGCVTGPLGLLHFCP